MTYNYHHLDRCTHCGCKFDEHRGGSDNEPAGIRHKCPPTEGYGRPRPFPRATAQENATSRFEPYWARIDAYWASEKVFQK